jgi:hypothetical protein
VTRDELSLRLTQLGIRPDAYNLSGEATTETYILEERYGIWRVFYSERGVESQLAEFETESDACEHLLSLLLLDSTTRLRS